MSAINLPCWEITGLLPYQVSRNALISPGDLETLNNFAKCLKGMRKSQMT